LIASTFSYLFAGVAENFLFEDKIPGGKGLLNGKLATE